MKTFNYTIQDELGIHARPAGLLVKEVKNFKSTITLQSGEKKAVAKNLIAIMGLAIKKGNVVTVTAEGEDEEVAIVELEKFFKKNL